MDHPIEQPRGLHPRAVRLALVAIAVLVVAAALTPTVRRWSRADASVDADSLRLGEVVRGDLIRQISAEGRVAASFRPTLFSPARGIVSISVEAGQLVEAGQVLARIASPELESRLAQERAVERALTSDHSRLALDTRRRQLANEQQAELRAVKVAAAERAFKRTEKLFGLGLVNEIDLEAARDAVTVETLELEQARQRVSFERDMLAFELDDARQRLDRQRLVVSELERRIDALSVLSPVAGSVSRVHVDDREAVVDGTPLVSVVDLTAFEVEFAVAEAEAAEIGPDTPAEVGHAGTTYPARVQRISPEVESSRVKGALVFTSSSPAGIMQNQRVTVHIRLETRPDVLKVRRGPFLEAGNGRFVYVVNDGLATRRPIETGAVSVTEVEILQGLEPGERIVLSDTSRFDDAVTVFIRD
jgi:HlyD family secretion protein